MKKILVFAIASCAFAASAQEGLNRQVEVTKAYTPEVGATIKLSAQPRMEDTVALRPHIEYAIRPAGWQTAFGVRPIPAASIDTRLYHQQPQLYIKAGAGYPLQSVADVYFHRRNDVNSFGAYLNHAGQYADIDNALDVATDAAWSTNRVGAYADLKTGRRTSFNLAADYDWNYFTRYGQAVPVDEPAMNPGKASSVGYTCIGGSLGFGTNMAQTGKFNYRLGAKAYRFADRKDNAENNVTAFAQMGTSVGIGQAMLDLCYDGYFGEGGVDFYKNNIVSIRPQYAFTNDKFKMSVGLDLTVDDNFDNSGVYFFPKFSMSWDVAWGYMVPFVEADGGLYNNGLRSLVKRNPYVISGAISNMNTAYYSAYAGFYGSTASGIGYKLYVGGKIYESHIGFTYNYVDGFTGAFLPGVQDVTQATLGGELSARIAGGFDALITARVHAYPENSDDDVPADLPSGEIGISARYNHLDKLLIGAGVDLIGTRYFYGCIDYAAGGTPFVDTKVTSAADIYLTAEYRISPDFGVFVEGRNLLNTNLFPYNHYRGQGINVMGGVKIKF